MLRSLLWPRKRSNDPRDTADGSRIQSEEDKPATETLQLAVPTDKELKRAYINSTAAAAEKDAFLEKHSRSEQDEAQQRAHARAVRLHEENVEDEPRARKAARSAAKANAQKHEQPKIPRRNSSLVKRKTAAIQATGSLIRAKSKTPDKSTHSLHLCPPPNATHSLILVRNHPRQLKKRSVRL